MGGSSSLLSIKRVPYTAGRAFFYCKTIIDNMPFVKGKSGNPNGPPRVPEIALLREALEKAKKKHKKSLLQHAVDQAYIDNGVLAVILKKIVPDLTHNRNEDIVNIVSMPVIKKDGAEIKYNVGS